MTDFSMLIHKKPITVVSDREYHTQSHLPSLHFLCVFNTAQTPIMSYQFSPCFYTQSCLLSLHSMFYTHKTTHYHLTPCFLYIQSHLLSLCSCFIHTNPLTITSLHVLYTQSHLLPFYFLHPFFCFFVPNIIFCTYLHSHQIPFGIVCYGALCICGEFEWPNPKKKKSGRERGGGNPSKQQCTGRKADTLT